MTGSVIMAYDPSQVTDGAQVTVVTGTQFTVNPRRRHRRPRRPAPPRPTSSSAPPPATTSTTSPGRGGHRRPFADDLEPRALGSPGLPGRRHPHRAGGQPDLTGAGAATAGRAPSPALGTARAGTSSNPLWFWPVPDDVIPVGSTGT